MDSLHFIDYEDFAYEVVNKFDSLTDDFCDVSVIAKYDEAKDIIRELVCLGYPIASIDIHIQNWDNYYDEYIVSLNFDGIWCEPFKRDGKYISDMSTVTYILDNCSSACIPYCESEEIYEVSVGEDNEFEYECDKCDFHECTCCKGSPKSNDDSTYHITIKGDLDMGDAEKIVESMECRMMHIQDMLNEMNHFRELFRW